MLITCPECSKEISDKAPSCPHCGIILKDSSSRNRNKSKKMKLPNGFGRITKLKGNLRKPYRAMVSVGKDSNGNPIGKLLKPVSYFETYNEAYQALMEYNKSPYDFSNNMTIKELYEKWSDEKFKEVSASRIRAFKASWKYCEQIYDVKVQELTAKELRNFFDYCSSKLSLKDNMTINVKSMLTQMLDYALEYELVEKNVAKNIKLKTKNLEVKKQHEPFTEEEFEKIKAHVNDSIYMEIIYVNCYMGWRPSELLELELDNINLEKWFAVGGSKTKAGKNRIVPIHKSIRDMIKKRYDEGKSKGHKYLFTRNGANIYYKYYSEYFKKELKRIGIEQEHRPHDCRKHFITMAKRYSLDEYVIKLIVGHVITDITESIYTKRDLESLQKEMDKLP